MIVYRDILQHLAAAGWSTYRLAKENVLSANTINRIRNGLPLTTTTLDTICRLCSCQPGDLLHYVPDPGPDE